MLPKVVKEHLRTNGIKIANSTIVDATIINAPSTTKNQDGKRDLEMHQAAKDQQWYFGMKTHVGVDSKTRQIQTILASAANVADAAALPYLLHGCETRVWGDHEYQGQIAVIRARAPRARDSTNSKRRGRGWSDPLAKARNGTMSRMRAKVEHSIGGIKRVFGFQKVR
jgi:IS5 family transposase